MKIGKYQIGKYHAIIKKIYDDGSFDYETSFTSQADLFESVHAVKSCIGKLVGVATDNTQILTDMNVIRGREAIEKELENK